MRGSIFDVLIWAVALSALAVGILVGKVIMTNIQTSTSTLLAEPEAVTGAMAKGQTALNTFDYGFVIIAAGMMLAGIMFAWMIPSHPIFIVLSILMLLIFMLVIPVLSNAFVTMSAETTMSTASASFPLMNFIMGNLPLWATVFGIMIMIVTYTRWRSSGVA